MAWPAVLPPWPVWRGDAFSWPLTVQNSSGGPLDLTTYGSTWTAQIRASLATATELDFTVVATSAASGILTFTLTGAQTATLNAGQEYGFDIQVTGGALSPLTLFRGSLKVDGEFTHA